jgi:hypothetical protein
MVIGMVDVEVVVDTTVSEWTNGAKIALKGPLLPHARQNSLHHRSPLPPWHTDFSPPFSFPPRDVILSPPARFPFVRRHPWRRACHLCRTSYCAALEGDRKMLAQQ